MHCTANTCSVLLHLWSKSICSRYTEKLFFNYFFHVFIVFMSTGDNYFVGPKRMTWNDARIQCESKEDVLVTISNTSINSEVQGLLTDVNGDDSDSRAWIGLNRSKSWDWSGPSEPGEEYTFTNWQNGQPDNVNGENSCVAVALTDGTWTDEPCNATYPFFCYGSMNLSNISTFKARVR